MTLTPEQTRLREVILTGCAALVLFAMGLAGFLLAGSDDDTPTRSGPVLPRLADDSGAVYTIEITTKEDRFVLQEDGEGWALLGRGGYAADAGLAARLIARLSALEYDGPRTADPARHSLLGLEAPEEGGDATSIVLRDFDSNVIGEVLVGARRGERGTYLRLPGEDQAWAADGVLPAIATPQDWMNLDFLALGADSIARAYVVPVEGPPYFLERPGLSQRNFALRAPSGWQLITPGAGNGTGTVLGRLRFRDVRPARFEERPIARYEAETFSGLRLEIAVHDTGGARWAVIRAIALTDDAMGDALALNNHADQLAFRLSELTEERMIRPLSEIAERVIRTDDAP